MTRLWEADCIWHDLLIILWRSVLWLHRGDTCIFSLVRYGFVHQDTGRQMWPFTICQYLQKWKTREETPNYTVCGVYRFCLCSQNFPFFEWMTVLVDRSDGLESFFQVKRIARYLQESKFSQASMMYLSSYRYLVVASYHDEEKLWYWRCQRLYRRRTELFERGPTSTLWVWV